jgi:hypothetical protein
MNDFNLTNFAPKGWHTVTPRLVVHDASQLVAFLNKCSTPRENIARIVHPKSGSATRSS